MGSSDWSSDVCYSDLDHPVQPGGVPDQRLPLELLRRVGRERGDQRRGDPRLPRAVPAGRVVDLPHRLETQVVGGSGMASLNQGSTVPLTLTVIGLPRRSSALPNGSRTQPSLTQYSSTLVFSSPLKRTPMPRSSAAASWKRLRGSLDRRSGGVSLIVVSPCGGRAAKPEGYTHRPAWVARQPQGQGCDRPRRAPPRASSRGQASLRPRPCRRLDDAWHATSPRGRRNLPTPLPPRLCTHARAPPLPGIVSFRQPSHPTGPSHCPFRPIPANAR